MDTQILGDLGFSSAETKIYLALLELGVSTAGPIIERSGLQSSVTHMTLNKLITKGFISFVKEGKRNHYQATNPKHISEYIDEKKEQFEKILPELLLKQQTAKEKSEVTTFKEIKGIRALLYELLDAGGDQHLTIGSCEQSLMLGEGWWVQYHSKRKEKNITAKQLFNESLREWAEKNYAGISNMRFTKQGFEPLTETIIRNDKVGIIIWTEKPLGILIHNKIAAKSYEQFFKILWEGAHVK